MSQLCYRYRPSRRVLKIVFILTLILAALNYIVPKFIHFPAPLPPCSDIFHKLKGAINVSKWPVPSFQDLEMRFSWLKPGGHWSPETCQAPKSVALVVPYRNRSEHLRLFLQHMHPFLRHQQLDYTIYIVQQDGNFSDLFNRAMLMNVGFKEALTIRNYDCFIFHDVDLLPENDKNLYTCPSRRPRHMSFAVDVYKYQLPYHWIFGGVSAVNRQEFEFLNGFSNSFWGWGGEDDDMSKRIIYRKLKIQRYSQAIARYTMLKHTEEKPNPDRYNILKRTKKKFLKDGLNSIKYTLVQLEKKLLYTWVLVELEKPKQLQ